MKRQQENNNFSIEATVNCMVNLWSRLLIEDQIFRYVIGKQNDRVCNKSTAGLWDDLEKQTYKIIHYGLLLKLNEVSSLYHKDG